MKHKWAILLAGWILVLAGCSLAQPEADSREDAFVGFYVTYDSSGEGRNGFYNNPNWIEYGTETLATEYGQFSIPKTILEAEEEDGQFTFPGLEGSSLFLVYTGEGSDTCISSASGMADSQMDVLDTDEGITHRLTGTVYIGPPSDAGADWNRHNSSGVVVFNRVYRTPDGMIYLDGSGNSASGIGSYWETMTNSEAIDGEAVSETVEVKVNVAYVPRLEKLVVSQFDENNVLLRSDELALRENLPEVNCMEETAWALVEEYSEEGAVRTVYSPPAEGEDPSVSHNVVLLDDGGWGKTAELSIRFS